MGTLTKGFRLKILPPALKNDHLHQFPVLVFVITLMIAAQVPMMSCSGGVNLARPYLFRDYEMLSGYGPQQHSSSSSPARGNMFHHQQKSSASYADSASAEDGSSEEGDEESQYTAPLILDIDDPEGKARWMGLSEMSSDEEDDDDDEEYYEDEEGQPRSMSSTEFAEEQGQPRSMSSTEFSSRSSQQIRTSGESEQKTEKQTSQKKPGESSGNGGGATASGNAGSGAGEESRGIMDSFSLNPFSYWQGESDHAHSEGELPQSDELTEYAYYPYAYDTSGNDYYYDPNDPSQQDDQKKPIMPHLVPVQKAPPKPKPKPKPVVVKQKVPKAPSPPKIKKKKPPKQKVPKPPKMKVKKRKRKKHPPPPPHQQVQYIEFTKPDKLSIISEKLSKLNPFRYFEIQKPQITITKHGDPPGPPPHMKMKRKKPKRPKGPKKPKPPPMIKYKPKPQAPKPKQKPKKPHADQSNPEFVMMFGEPYNFGGYSDDGAETQVDYRDGATSDEEADDDDDDNDEDEDEDEEEYEADDDEEEEDGYGQQYTVSHRDEEAEETDTETGQSQTEDDEGDYEDGVIGLTKEVSTDRPTTETQPEEEEEEVEQKQRLGLSKLFGWRKKKKRRPRRPKPARKPPHWKEYRPAPLLPEFPEKVSDAVMTVIKHVGFLPEYDKTEKYGGHNKIKGKFTKTRPITLHHGLLTEVLRRR